MNNFEYSQGVDADGPVLLKDGHRVGLDELLADISGLQETADGLLAACKALYATHKPGKGQCCAAADMAIDAIAKAEASKE